MIWQLMKLTLNQKRTAILAYCLGGLTMILLYVAIYPSLESQIGNYKELYKSLPSGVMKAFGADTPLTNFEGLLGVKQFGLVWPLLCVFFMISFAGSTLAGEIEKRTLGLWLAAPLTRLQMYWSKLISSMLALVLFVLASVTAVVPVADLFNVEVSTSNIVALSITGFMFGATVASLGFLAASYFSEKSKVYTVVGSLILVMYVCNLLAGLTSSLVNLKFISIFYYYNSNDLLTGQPINVTNMIVFALVSITCILAGAAIFKRRDVSI